MQLVGILCLLFMKKESSFYEGHQQVMDLSFKRSEKPSERIHKDLSEINNLPGDTCCKHSQLQTSFLKTMFRETKLLH